MGFDRRNYSSRAKATIVRGSSQASKDSYPGLKPSEVNRLRREGATHRQIDRLSRERLAQTGQDDSTMYPGLTAAELRRFRRAGMNHRDLKRQSDARLE